MRWAVAVVAVVGVLAAAPAAHALSVDYTCTPNGCAPWHNTNVQVKWIISGATSIVGCGDAIGHTETFTSSGQALCQASDGSATNAVTLTIRIDKTAPTVTGVTPSRSADANGWYRRAVGIAFHGLDRGGSGLASCTSTTYGGPDASRVRVLGTCTDTAGNTSAALAFPLRYDATPPVVKRAIPRRKPDHGIWFNHPVRVRFRAKDAVSGLDECQRAVLSGASSLVLPVVGTCRDKAGNVASRAFTFPFDSLPPAVPTVTGTPWDRALTLHIAASADTARLRVVRSPGVRGHKRSVVYRGRPQGFSDRRVVNGRAYRYAVAAFDKAGNVARREVVFRPGPRLIGPPGAAPVSAPPRLGWTPVRGARYYNVQLFRGGRKILSAWPTRSHYQLRPRWRFAGRVQRLRPGAYRWYVWPGIGPRSARHFGRLIGSRTFTLAG